MADRGGRARCCVTRRDPVGLLAICVIGLLEVSACGGNSNPSPSGPSPPPPPGSRFTIDQPDEVFGDQVHVLYVLPSDGLDRGPDFDSTINASIQLARDWVIAQTNNRHSVRFDLFRGSLDLTVVRLGRPDSDYVSMGVRIREALEVDLAAMGFNQPSKIYAVFYGGGSARSGVQIACGQAGRPGRMSFLYVECLLERSDVPPLIAVHGLPKMLGLITIHEIFHALGAAPDCAPHQVAAHVTDDPRDIMVASGSGQLSTFRDPGFLPLLDAGRDDYYGHGNSGCLDLANSPFFAVS